MNVKSLKNWVKENRFRFPIIFVLLVIFGFVLLKIGQLEVAIGSFIGAIITAIIKPIITPIISKLLKKESNKTAEAQEQGNIEERYKNAIKQLGNEKSSVRLAGAYGLYHLAKDNKDRRENICNVLCVHIRELTTSTEPIFNKKSYSERYKDKPSDEVQSILYLLTNKDNKEDFPFKSDWINLENTYLNGADLRRAQLQEANLKAAQLQGANLDGAQLKRANLEKAQLQGADLTTAQLQGAVLLNAELQGANLYQAQLQGALLIQAQLQDANLKEAQLQGAYLDEAQLQGANLDKTDFRGAFAFTKENTKISVIMRLKSRINKKNNIKGVTFSGGVTQKQLDDFKIITTAATLGNLNKIKNYDQDKINDFIQKMNKVEKILEENIGKPPIFKPPKPFKAITGSYSQAEANEVITMLEGVGKELKKQDNLLKIYDLLIE